MPPPTPIDYTQIEYNGRRLRYLVYPALFVNLYYTVFLYFVYSFEFVSLSETSFVRPDLARPIAIQMVVLILLLIAGFAGLAQIRDLGVKGSFWMLAVSTALFIATICVPMYFWGGSQRSVFGPLLATVSGLTVMVAKKPVTRVVFGMACLVAFTLLSTFYKDIFPNKGPISASSPYSGIKVYLIFQTVAALATIVIAILLSWKNAQDRTMFGDDVGRIHLLQHRANKQQRGEMLQTSIKLAIDLNRGTIAGGGLTYTESLTTLIEAGSRREDIWCAEWTPASGEIIPGTLKPATQTTSVPPEIEDRITEIVRAFLTTQLN